MKILVITSRYPPEHFGGYGLRCKDIVDELTRRGHEILVLTSIKESISNDPFQRTAYGILRRLHVSLKADSFLARLTLRRWTYHLGMVIVFARELYFDLLDLKFIAYNIRNFRPDIIYLGHIIILSKALLPYLADCGIPMAYDEGGSGLIDLWEDKGVWYKFLEISGTRNILLSFVKFNVLNIFIPLSGDRLKSKWGWPGEMRIFFNSELGRRNAIAKGIPVETAVVIHSGIGIEKFEFKQKNRMASPLSIIVPGRIEPLKGQMDAVRLLAKIIEDGIDAQMIMIGKCGSVAYFQEIKQEINRGNLNDRITIHPMVSREALVDYYHVSDICFFPSYQKAGLSRTPLEAMACGCVLISYGNEGSDEVILDKQNGFLVSPADFQGMSEIIIKLMADSLMFKNILGFARKKVEHDCSLPKYVDHVEKLLKETARID